MATFLTLSREELWPLIAVVAESGHRIIAASDSGNVVQQVERRRPDVVLLPDDAEPIDGEELMSKVRSLTGAPLIALGECQESKMLDAFSQGADAYVRYHTDIVKTFPWDILK